MWKGAEAVGGDQGVMEGVGGDKKEWMNTDETKEWRR